MARSKRRSTRSNLTLLKSPEPSPLSSRSNTPLPKDASEQPPQPAPANAATDDSCPECPPKESNALDKESWIRCDVCKVWYHWRCVGNGGDMDAVDKWYCKACLAADPSRTITFKAPTRRSFRKRTQRDYANLHAGVESDPKRWLRMMEGKTLKDHSFKLMKGADVGLEWLEEDDTAMTEPILIESPEGLGMRVPPSDFTVDDVTRIVGEVTPLEVIDVATQSTSSGWTLGKWNEYFNMDPSSRDKTLNVISLEISGTPLSDMILPPRLVRELDWVENFWPSTRKGKGHAYPKVQLYCLMGVANAWTDWHIDFAGSSVYYHILRGAKVFYFIRPTSENLSAYERWSGSELQNQSWLGDLVDEVFKVELTAGNTMIIPTGWIHAVHTPVDTLVFGGNFLHSYNVPTQLRVRNIEIATQVPKKFRFPMFSKLCWYVGDKYLRDIKGGTSFSHRVLTSVSALADFLVTEARILEHGSEQARREVKEQIPGDRVKDAPAMARELRWRARLAAGYSSDDEMVWGANPKRKDASYHNSNGVKRRRVDSASPFGGDEPVRFKNFQPKNWDKVVEDRKEEGLGLRKMRRPKDEEGWVEEWMNDARIDDEEGSEAETRRVMEKTVRVRRTIRGVERQQIERTVEEWTWVK